MRGRCVGCRSEAVALEAIWSLRACDSDPVLQRDLMEADGGEEIRGRTGGDGGVTEGSQTRDLSGTPR